MCVCARVCCRSERERDHTNTFVSVRIGWLTRALTVNVRVCRGAPFNALPRARAASIESLPFTFRIASDCVRVCDVAVVSYRALPLSPSRSPIYS